MISKLQPKRNMKSSQKDNKSRLSHLHGPKEKLQQSCRILIYISLFVGTFIFSQSCLREYVDGTTASTTQNLALQNKDAPTLTVCLYGLVNKPLLRYGEDVKISLYPCGHTKRASIFSPAEPCDFDQTKLDLKNGLNVLKNSRTGSQMFFEIEQHYVRQQKSTLFSPKRSCYKIAIGFSDSENEIGTPSPFKTHLYQINSVNGSQISAAFAPYLTFTSEANAYGSILNKWNDGIVDTKHELKIGYHRFIFVTEVRTFEYVDWHCSPQSYYECLGQLACDFPECSRSVHKLNFFCFLFDMPGGQINDPSSERHFSLPFLTATPRSPSLSDP